MWLHDYLDHRAAFDPDSELSVLGSRTLTCGEGADYAGRLASSLARNGLVVGTRVAYLSKNSLEFGLVYAAASKAGVVPVPLNYRLVPREWAYIIDDAGAEIVFAQGQYMAGIDTVRDELTTVNRFVCLDGDPGDGWESMSDWLDAAPMSRRRAAERACEDAYQMYTSGTTGRPKGAVIGQQGLLCTLMQWRLALPIAPGERALVVSPMYHGSGTLTTFHAIASGGSTYVMTDFDATETARVLDEERISFTMLVPAMIQAILTDCAGRTDRTYADLRTILYGASAISASTLRQAIQLFKCDFIQSFGMTEMPNLVYLTADDHLTALAGRPDLLLAAGRPGPGTSLKIVDDNGNEVAPGTVGEICARGGQVMQRYWKRPEATAAALRDGWMHTGDAGYVDEAGYLFIRDRIKDMISSGAENVYPREVEDVLFEHPDIADAAVIGIPSERWGETVHAEVVLRPGAAVTEQDVIDFCEGRIAGYKRPRSVAFRDELPHNASGKVLKDELRAAAWEGHGRNIG